MNVKQTVKDLLENHYEEFVKELISYEHDITDADELEEIYQEFLSNDSIVNITDISVLKQSY